jgi:hypothetical protein
LVSGECTSGCSLGEDANGDRYNSLQANYLSIPVYIFACLVLCFIAWVSDKLNKRALVVMMVPIPVLVGYAIVIGTANNGAGLFAMFLVAAGKFGLPSPIY